MRVSYPVAALLILSSLAPPGAAAAPADTGGWTAVDSIVAVVNQDVVLQSEFDRRLATFKASLDAIKDPAERGKRRLELQRQILRGLVDERLFTEAAVAIGLTATGEEVNLAVGEVKAKNKLDDAGMARALAENGYTMEQYREEIQRQILQAKVSNLVLRPRVRVTEKELQAAYEEAQKRDPQRIGTLAEVREPLQQRLFEEAMIREQGRWLAERRAEAYIDVRIAL